MLRQKLYAIILAVITLWTLKLGVGDLAIITIPASIMLFFSKTKYIR